MASLFDDFEVGVAGLSDAVGFTDHAAADLVVSQAAEDAPVPPDPKAVDAAKAAAEQQEATGDVLGQAASMTAAQVKDAAKAVGKAADDASRWAIGTVLALVPWYVWAGAGVVVVGAVVGVVYALHSDTGKGIAKDAAKAALV